MADFACVSKKLVIEIDGGYHDHAAEYDCQRESFMRKEGWDVLRFSDDDVEQEAELVARGIAQYVGLEYEFDKRQGTGSGSRKRKPSP